MDPLIEALYQAAPRFDEGEVFLGEEYHEAKQEQLRLYDLIVATFGPEVAPMLNDYADTFFSEMECEAQHFFQEGYRAASKK